MFSWFIAGTLVALDPTLMPTGRRTGGCRLPGNGGQVLRAFVRVDGGNSLDSRGRTI
jgi:hypothetical protein